MAKYGDSAWTSREPGGILDEDTPPDLRISDTAFGEMPAGGWYLPGGSSPIKVPQGHDPANPGNPPALVASNDGDCD